MLVLRLQVDVSAIAVGTRMQIAPIGWLRFFRKVSEGPALRMLIVAGILTLALAGVALMAAFAGLIAGSTAAVLEYSGTTPIAAGLADEHIRRRWLHIVMKLLFTGVLSQFIGTF